MVLFPNCKINLGLHILSKRKDNYHNIETIFLPLSLTDILEVIVPESGDSTSSFSLSGIPVEMEPRDNLCSKALHLLQKDFASLPAISTHLHKNIPVGAGLGGGSSDATHMLLLLNKKFNLELIHEKLAAYALALGSDCPFFLKNKPCLASSRGELLNEISLDLSRFHFALVYPGVSVDTAWAFSQVIARQRSESLRDIIQLPISGWKENLVNDFEVSVFKKYLQVKEIKDYLYTQGAVYASMSGSGSCVFGMFENKPPAFSFPSNYLVFNDVVQLSV